MTQEIPYSARSFDTAAPTRATRTSADTPSRTERRDSWFVKALSELRRVLIHRRFENVPESLIDDVGLRRHATSRELRPGSNGLDAQLYARFY